ncbi:MAG: hypothetical protein QOF58_6568 [Pseudonocardiales bacterium]|jgi:hypothetical protein|nr:hypothetical protein [Pseudonocardiales bacterium]
MPLTNDPPPLTTVLRSPEVRAAAQSGDVGVLVRAIRIGLGLTLAELGARTGYCASAVSRLETGKASFAAVDVRSAFVTALGLPPRLLGLADTTGTCTPPVTSAARVGGTAASSEGCDPMRRRTVLTGLTSVVGGVLLGATPARAIDPITALEDLVLVTPTTAGPPPTARRAWSLLATARDQFQSGAYHEVAVRLPDLLGHALAGRDHQRDSDDEARLLAAISQLYTLATEVMIKLGVDHAAWATADRARQFAHAGNDTLSTASANRVLAILLRRNGRAERASALIHDTAAAVQSQIHLGPNELSMYGSLLTTAAYTAAVDGDRDTARTLITEAADTAQRLGADANHRWTAFGPTNVAIYQIGIDQVLGDFGTAIAHASSINFATIAQPERRARGYTDMAKAYHLWGKPEECFRALLAAERDAPDELLRKPVQDMTLDLLSQAPNRILPQVRALAVRAGV